MGSSRSPSVRAGDGRGAAPRRLEDPVRFVPGVGPTRAAVLGRLGIANVNDLLTHFPRTWYDRRSLTPVGRLAVGQTTSFTGEVLTIARVGGRRRGAARVVAAVGDDTGVVHLVWFNQAWMMRVLGAGRRVVATGTVTEFRGQRQVVNPEFELIDDERAGELLDAGRIVPVYPATRGVSQRYLRRIVRAALDGWGECVEENLPRSLVEAGLPPRRAALEAVHYPPDEAAREAALDRFRLEELFYVQLALGLIRRRRRHGHRREPIRAPRRLEEEFVRSLGFELTGAQRRVIGEIHADLASEAGMNRLLQGDVGAGKTVVAGVAMLAAVEAGMQAAMMAPTEILASQHHATLARRFADLGVELALLTGSMSAADKKAVHARLASGELRAVVGTHALIQEGVSFRRLGLVVIDEQHRFGVRQRAALVRDGHAPHMLVMTATPIPRTLALVAYADLDLSVLDEMPAVRRPVRTRLVPPQRREAMYAYIRERAMEGEQAYLLFPVIEDSDAMDVESAEAAWRRLVRGALRDVPVGLLHGRLAAADKDRVMRAFAAGDLRVLVATTVIEVGVHVPAATIMAIHHAERFGLSQLHQLRGRVGRGGRDGYCFLLPGDDASTESLERLRLLVEQSDGFRIAEEDLRLRGPGEFLGVRQSGVPGFRLANPLRDGELVERAGREARRLIDADPDLATPDGRRCRRYLRALVTDDVALREIL